MGPTRTQPLASTPNDATRRPRGGGSNEPRWGGPRRPPPAVRRGKLSLQMSPKATLGPNEERGRRTVWPWQGLRHSQPLLASSAGARSYAAAQGKEKPTQNKAHNPEIWASWSAGHGTADGRKRPRRIPFVGVLIPPDKDSAGVDGVQNFFSPTRGLWRWA
jgi:hypothetical protein